MKGQFEYPPINTFTIKELANQFNSLSIPLPSQQDWQSYLCYVAMMAFINYSLPHSFIFAHTKPHEIPNTSFSSSLVHVCIHHTVDCGIIMTI